MRFVIAAVLFVAWSASPAEAEPGLGDAQRVLFLGDSITHAGKYVAYAETYLRLRDPRFAVEFINCGLSSETVSGLSEPGHAGGAFPRPDVHERLDRVLAAVKPDLVVACYGMNCGIYHPFSEERFADYRAGMELLRRKAAAAGARVLHVTPPVFDPLPIREKTLPAGRDVYDKPYAGYNDVLDRYSAWLVSKRADGWDVCDAHTPMNDHIAAMRRSEPNFTLAKDGVHPGATGQWLLARALLSHWSVPAENERHADDGDAVIAKFPHGGEVLKLIERRLALVHDAWLTKTGHKRPGVKAGLPLEEAQRQAAEIEKQIAALLKPVG